MTRTKIRAFIAGLITVIVLILFAAVGSRMLGYDLPVLGGIADMLGIPVGAQ